MSSRKIIAVLGATGAQGGSVVDTFTNDPTLNRHWAVRAITRDPSKEKAQKLRDRTQVVQADLDDKSSLVKAFSGAVVVFAVTNFWEKMSKDLEVQQGKNIVDAAEESGLLYLIWSSLRNVTELSRGKLTHVEHFDSKAEVEKYAIQRRVPAIFFLAGFYMQNLIGNLLKPEPPHNTWSLILPTSEDAPIPLFDVESTGAFIKAIVTKRDQLLGKRVLGASEYKTPKEIVEEFKEQFPDLGEGASYRRLSPEGFQERLVQNYGLPPYAALVSSETFMAFYEGGYYGFEPLHESLALLEDEVATWRKFLATKATVRS